MHVYGAGVNCGERQREVQSTALPDLVNSHDPSSARCHTWWRIKTTNEFFLNLNCIVLIGHIFRTPQHMSKLENRILKKGGAIMCL